MQIYIPTHAYFTYCFWMISAPFFPSFTTLVVDILSNILQYVTTAFLPSKRKFEEIQEAPKDTFL